MPGLKQFAAALALAITLAPARSSGAPAAPLPLALREVNPDMLSSGLYAALEAQGAFGGAAEPPRARAVYSDASKGVPSPVMDARVAPNVRLGDDPDALPPGQRGQCEPHLARSPLRPAVLLATFQEGRFAAAGGAIGNGYSVSRDGGLTWTRALIPGLTQASGGPYLRATDPVAAIGPGGDMYLNALVSLDNAFGRAAVVVQRSADDGATWTAPVVIFEAASALVSPDKNWFAVNDHLAAFNAGRLACTWTNFTSTSTGTSTGSHLVASVSDDRGTTWSAPAEITPPGTRNQGSQPFFLDDGSLGVVYITFLHPTDVTQFSLSYKRSSNGGRTFPAAATTIVEHVAGWNDPELREGIFLPSATVAASTGEILVTYTAVVAGSPRIMVTRSADRGATWSAPMAVSDQPAGVSVVNPAIAALGSEVTVVFMDKRHAPGGTGAVDYSATWSLDGGRTWQPNTRLSEMSSPLRSSPQTATGAMLGDYLGVVMSAGSFPAVAIWADTRTGDADPFTVRFAPAAAADFAAWNSARGNMGTYLDDADGDGSPNYLEFLHGTDPFRAEADDSLLVRKTSASSVDLLWTERPDAPRRPIADGVSIAPIRTYASAGFGMAATLPSSLGAEELPDLPARPGLVWRGVRVAVEPGETYLAGRTIRLSAGLPSQAAGSATAFNTDARLINLSTRGFVGAGASQLIVGFAVDGSKSVLVRAAGPALAALGVAEALAAPRLSVTSAGSAALTNTQWQPGSAAAAAFARVGAFPFLAGSADAALLFAATQRDYTAVVGGTDNSAGVALVEAYDADEMPGAPAKPRFLNLSARGEAGAGSRELVAGFVLAGTQPRRVLVRAIGPALGAFGVAGVLNDPLLTIYRGTASLMSNDDWQRGRDPGLVVASAARVGAFPLSPGSLDAALLVTLPPGNYTATVTGADGGTGIALVEVYDADEF